MADGNIIDVVFRATVGPLQQGMAQAKTAVADATAGMRTSMDGASSSFDAAAAAIDKGADKISASAQQATRSIRNIRQETEDLKRIDGVIDGNVKSFKELADAEAALDRLQKANLLTSEMQEQAFNSLTEAEDRLTKETKKLGDEQEKTGAKSTVLRTNLQSVITNAMLGQWEGFTSATGTLAINMGSTGAAAAGAVAGIGALVVAIAALTAGAIAGSLEQDRYNRAIATSGNVTGQTADSMDRLAEKVAGGAVTISDAAGALNKMAASGKFNIDTMELGASAAANFARVTGMSMDEAVSKVMELAEDPKKAVIELNEQFGFLTVEQYNLIKALQDTQGETAAMAEALRILDTESAKRAKALAEQAGWVERAWLAVKNAVVQAKNAIMDIGKTQSPLDKLRDQLRQIESATNNTNSANPYSGIPYEQRTAMAARLRAQIEALSKKEKEAAEQTARWNQAQKDSVTAASYIDRVTLSYDRQGQKVKELTELQRQYMALRKTAPGDARLEGVVWDDKTGKPLSGGSYGKAVAGIEEEYAPPKGPKGKDPAVEARRLAAEQARAAREAAMEEMTALAIKRDATREASEERMALDQTIVDRAKALYGENSSQYRAALNQQTATKEAHAERIMALDQVIFDKGQDLKRLQIDEAMQLAQEDYARGRITAAQLLDVERDLIQQKLQLQVDYYERKKAAAEAAGDTVGAAQAAAAIAVATEQAMIQAREAERNFQDESMAGWQQWGDMVAGSMAQLAQNMIFQGMTWRDAFVSVLGSLLQQFIGFCSQMLSKWIATKTAEVMANLTANTAKVASDKMAAKESVLANAGAAIKKILANGAEVFTSVYKAIAGIPYVGPFLAPVMAVAAGAAVVGMVSKVASAEKGWERVPADGVLTELHKDEQVLPAEYAEGLRRVVADGGRGGGGGTINVTTLDGRSFKRFLQDNAEVLTGVLGGETGNFRFEG